jgi:hypothetical protein
MNGSTSTIPTNPTARAASVSVLHGPPDGGGRRALLQAPGARLVDRPSRRPSHAPVRTVRDRLRSAVASVLVIAAMAATAWVVVTRLGAETAESAGGAGAVPSTRLEATLEPVRVIDPVVVEVASRAASSTAAHRSHIR